MNPFISHATLCLVLLNLHIPFPIKYTHYFLFHLFLKMCILGWTARKRKSICMYGLYPSSKLCVSGWLLERKVSSCSTGSGGEATSLTPWVVRGGTHQGLWKLAFEDAADVRTHTHTHINTHTYIDTRTLVHTCTRLCTHTITDTNKYIDTHVRTCTCSHTLVYTQTHLYMQTCFRPHTNTLTQPQCKEVWHKQTLIQTTPCTHTRRPQITAQHIYWKAKTLQRALYRPGLFNYFLMRARLLKLKNDGEGGGGRKDYCT